MRHTSESHQTALVRKCREFIDEEFNWNVFFGPLRYLYLSGKTFLGFNRKILNLPNTYALSHFVSAFFCATSWHSLSRFPATLTQRVMMMKRQSSSHIERSYQVQEANAWKALITHQAAGCHRVSWQQTPEKQTWQCSIKVKWDKQYAKNAWT